MARAIIGTNVKVEVEATLGSPVTITGITLANPGVVTATSHGYANGDVVKFSISSGMPQLDGQAVRVANITTNTFETENLDTTSFDAFVAGTVTKVASFSTFAKAQDFTCPTPAPKKIDETTLIDKQRQYTYGLPDAPDGKITALFNPGGTVEAHIAALAISNSAAAFRVTYADARKTIFNANVAFGQGFNLKVDAAATTEVYFTPIQQMLHYSS